jgi:hypothetical protein
MTEMTFPKSGERDWTEDFAHENGNSQKKEIGDLRAACETLAERADYLLEVCGRSAVRAERLEDHLAAVGRERDEALEWEGKLWIYLARARESLPADPGSDKPWSQCIAILDEAIEAGERDNG